LSVESNGTSTVNQADPGEESLTTKVSDYLSGTFRLTLATEYVANLKKLIKITFENLKTDGTTSKNSAQYRIISSIPYEGLTDYFNATIITIKLAALVEKKEYETTENYSAEITHNRLLVNEEYKFSGSDPEPTRPLFYQVSKLSADLEPTLKEFVAVAELFVTPDANKKLRLDLSAFQDAVSKYTGDLLSPENNNGNTINSPTPSGETLTPKVVKYFEDTLHVKLDSKEAPYIKTLIDDAFASVKKDSVKSSDYRLIVATLYPDVPDYFYASLAVASFEKSGSNYKVNFSIKRLVVQKGFNKSLVKPAV
jgi:hypothetical protein